MPAHEHVNEQQFYYHMGHRGSREDIEQQGLAPSKWEEFVPKGVYMMPHYPNTAYGDDIYEVAPPAKMKIYNDPMDPGAVYSRSHIKPKHISRVGHTFSDDQGKEVHWHPEEKCPGRMGPPGRSWHEEMDTQHLETE